MDGFLDEIRKFLLQYVQRSGRLTMCLPAFRKLRFRKRLPIDFLVDIQRNGLDLHRHGRHHIRRLAFQDERIQSIDVHGSVTNDICSDELACSLPFLVEGLDRSVTDARELPDDALHLFELDAESPDLDLHILPADELDITIGTVAHDVSRPVRLPVCGIVAERIVQEHLGGLVRPAQVTDADLVSGKQQFSCGAHWESLTSLAYDVCADTGQRLADGHVRFLFDDILADGIDGSLRRTVEVEQLVLLRRGETGEFLSARNQILQ